MTSPLDDRALLARIAAADREAFRELYDRYAGRILAYVRVLGRGANPPEDVVQEVFLAVWRKAGSYRPERGDVAGWLYTVTRNKLVDLWRRSGAGEESASELDLTMLPEDEPPLGPELRLSVRQAVADLGPDQRRAIEMAYFGGLTYEETARRLAVPLGTLKSRIRAALVAMRRRFEGEATQRGGAGDA